jgi:hypothetical protein
VIHLRKSFGYAGAITGHADEDQFSIDFELDFQESEFGTTYAWEISGRRDSGQSTIVVVGPSVVGTLDQILAVSSSLKQSGRPMTADIEEGPEFTVAAAHDDHAISQEIERDEITRLL